MGAMSNTAALLTRMSSSPTRDADSAETMSAAMAVPFSGANISISAYHLGDKKAMLRLSE